MTESIPLDHGDARRRHVGVVALQLALVLLVVHQFRLESRTFFNVLLLASAGFVVHALLPQRVRFPFFTLLSLASIVLALGPVDGLSVILLGLALIGICHLPLALPWRALLLLLVGGLFALWRVGMLPGPWSVLVWPALASMFMFRLALYLYALKHEERRPRPAETLAYFFMLPNVCFPLYPVIDFSSFVRTWYDRPAERIYDTGVRWIVRGLVHLILYRYVYLYLAGDPDQLASLGDVVQFMLATFLLYLRVSGQFHIITGMLHLFGFALPETHHLYYLASSFTDFWRRINIYWKDFMLKLVYMPSYFRLRRWGNTPALVIATLVVFASTWLLHSYQWFWLRGGFPLTPQDALFWAILGALVVAGSLRETRRPRRRTLGATSSRWQASLAFRTVGTFIAICVLWSLWSADSMGGWFAMWLAATSVRPGDLLLLAALLAAGLLIAGRPWTVRETDTAATGLRHPAVASTITLGLLLLVAQTELYAPATPRLAATVASLQHQSLNARDRTLRHRGYYENLDNTTRLSAALWEAQEQRPAHWIGLNETDAYQRRNDLLYSELRPGARIVFSDRPLSVNQWGMRDGDVSLAKPPGTFRIAHLGPSHVMGSGVSDGETLPDLLEERLNQGRDSLGGWRFEVLNFGVAGHSLVQQLAMLDDRVTQFAPDVVLITDSERGRDAVVEHLLSVAWEGVAIPYPRLDSLLRRTGARELREPVPAVPFRVVRAILKRLGIDSRQPWNEAAYQLRREADGFLRVTLDEQATRSRAAGALPVFIGLNTVEPEGRGDPVFLAAADSAGFLVFNLFDVWLGRDPQKLTVGSWDTHANATGNRLVAQRLFELIYQHRAALRLNRDTGSVRLPAR